MFIKKSNKIDSKKIAKERLERLIVRDRINISSEVLDMIKHDITNVVKDYLDIDDKKVITYLTNDKMDNKSTNTLLITIVPINKIKTID